MKKLLTIFISALITATLTIALPVFAQDAAPAGDAAAPGAPDKSDDLHIYYSEPLGAGERVFHVSTCRKEASYAPIKCSEALVASDAAFGAQCKPVGKDGNATLAPGKIVQGCLGALKERIPGTPYYKLTADDIVRFGNDGKGCGAPENQVYFYGPEYGVVNDDREDLAGAEGPVEQENSNTVMQGTLSWPDGFAGEDAPDGTVPQAAIDTVSPGGKAKKLYRPTLCATYDIVPDGSADKIGNDKVLDAIFEGSALSVDGSKEVFKETCNADNGRAKIGDIPMATPFDQNPTFSCSIVERITGKSGTDLFGRYISALYRWAASVVGIVAVLIMVYSGIQITIAGPDEAKITEAKDRIMQSLIGIAILFLSGVILYTINPGFFTGAT